jgi:hypothetical protein
MRLFLVARETLGCARGPHSNGIPRGFVLAPAVSNGLINARLSKVCIAAALRVSLATEKEIVVVWTPD